MLVLHYISHLSESHLIHTENRVKEVVYEISELAPLTHHQIHLTWSLLAEKAAGGVKVGVEEVDEKRNWTFISQRVIAPD